jgi:hypothetical protein
MAMTADAARGFRAARDAEARRLTRISRVDLERENAAELALRDTRRIYGKLSKDELIREILGYRYPVARLNEATHVLYHAPGETWSACDWCHPHHGGTCECDLRGAL